PPLPPPPTSTLFPYTTLVPIYRIRLDPRATSVLPVASIGVGRARRHAQVCDEQRWVYWATRYVGVRLIGVGVACNHRTNGWVKRDRKSTRLNSSHGSISYAVFC